MGSLLHPQGLSGAPFKFHFKPLAAPTKSRSVSGGRMPSPFVISSFFHEHCLQYAIKILTLHSNEKRPQSSQNHPIIPPPLLLRRYSIAISAGFQCHFGEISMASRRYYSPLSARCRRKASTLSATKYITFLFPVY